MCTCTCSVAIQFSVYFSVGNVGATIRVCVISAPYESSHGRSLFLFSFPLSDLLSCGHILVSPQGSVSCRHGA